MNTSESCWMPRRFIEDTGVPSVAFNARDSAAVTWADIAILRMLGHCIGHRVVEPAPKPQN